MPAEIMDILQHRLVRILYSGAAIFLVVVCSAWWYTFCHEGSHALAALACGAGIKKFYVGVGFGYVVHTNTHLLTPVSSVFILLAGSIGGAIFFFASYFIVALLIFKARPLREQIQASWEVLLKGFRVLAAGASSCTPYFFYSYLTVLVVGYYLHINRLIYALFPCISVVPFVHHYGSDGHRLWWQLGYADYIAWGFVCGSILNFMGLLFLLRKAWAIMQIYQSRSSIR